MNNAIYCKTLLGTKNLDFSIACLSSFVNNSYDEIRLKIFEDGSLTKSDSEQLISVFPTSEIIWRKDREPIILNLLRDYPNCYNFRKSSIFAHKLFDVSLLGSEDVFFIDSDVFFISKFKLPEFRGSPIFMKDKRNAYSFGARDFLAIEDLIYPKFNSGLFYFPQSAFNLSLLEKLLGDPKITAHETRKGWLEQTLWAFCAALTDKVYYFNPTQVILARRETKITEQTIAIHFVSTHRSHFKEFKDIEIDPNTSPKQMTITPIEKPLSNKWLLADALKQGVYRRIGKDL